MIEEKIEIPEGVKAAVSGATVEVSGTKGTLRRSFGFTGVTLATDGNFIVIKSLRERKREKAATGTIKAHIKNMIKGVMEGFTYRLKVVYSHFPITVKTEGKKVLIHNFIGERSPRVAEILGDCRVEVKGDEIIVSGTNKEDVAQTALRIEHATRVTGRDRRVFQDGCYIVEGR
ncbi:MAG: 50S ribosomal protein L6 [Candidatus Hadarchaeales archaeon]